MNQSSTFVSLSSRRVRLSKKTHKDYTAALLGQSDYGIRICLIYPLMQPKNAIYSAYIPAIYQKKKYKKYVMDLTQNSFSPEIDIGQISLCH